MAASDDQVPAKIQVSKMSYLAKVLAALILHSYQNYALFLPLVSCCFTLGRWSRAKNMMSEMLARLFWSKERSPARGLAWEAMVDSLNEIHSPKFQLKDKKVVRERWSLHGKKFSKKMSGEKKWDFCGRVYTEKQSLIEELVEREDTKG